MSAVPTFDGDLFDERSLADPFDDYRRLRDAGAVVRMTRPDVFAIGRFTDVQAALRNSATLISGEGVGFGAAFNAPRGRNVLQTDGDIHRRMRSTLIKPLMPAALCAVRSTLKTLISTRVVALKGRGPFDAMKDLAAFLPVEAVSHLVGLPSVGRERMLEWAAAAFNVIGPDQFPDDTEKMAEAFGYMSTLEEHELRDGSWAAELFAAADNGRLSRAEAVAAISAYVIPSLDTTILAKGHLLNNLATNPSQWNLLRTRAELIPAAVLEGVRHSAVIRWFGRVAMADYDIGSHAIPRGARVMLLYGSANRDERRYDDPDRFAVTRDARDHLAWGTGPHMCAGMHLARIEMEVLLEALVEADVELVAGTATVGVNRGLFGFEALPFELR